MSFDRIFFFRIWNLGITICTSFLAIYIPVKIVFHVGFEVAHPFYWVVNVAFALDIALSILKNQLLEDDIVVQRHYSVGHYLKSWFVIDLIAAIPWGLILGAPVIELIRLIKLAKVARFMNEIRERAILHSSVLSLFFFSYWALHSLHWLSCAWLAITGLDPGLSLGTNYLNALYWTTTTLTTVGYGDITPVTNTEKIFTIFMQLAGVAFYGFIIGNIASILTQKDPATSEYIESMDQLTVMSRYRHLPLSIQTKIRDFYMYKWKKKHGYNESEFLENLPPNLRRSVAIHMKKEFLDKIPLLKDANDRFLEAIALHLKPSIVTPGDYVFEAGAVGKAVYFLISGELSVIASPTGEVIATLNDGDMFGEIALFKDVPRTASIRAETYCDLYELNQQAFKKVVARFPEIASKIERIATERFEG